jgi:hypothetical protein
MSMSGPAKIANEQTNAKEFIPLDAEVFELSDEDEAALDTSEYDDDDEEADDGQPPRPKSKFVLSSAEAPRKKGLRTLAVAKKEKQMALAVIAAKKELANLDEAPRLKDLDAICLTQSQNRVGRLLKGQRQLNDIITNLRADVKQLDRFHQEAESDLKTLNKCYKRLLTNLCDLVLDGYDCQQDDCYDLLQQEYDAVERLQLQINQANNKGDDQLQSQANLLTRHNCKLLDKVEELEAALAASQAALAASQAELKRETDNYQLYDYASEDELRVQDEPPALRQPPAAQKPMSSSPPGSPQRAQSPPRGFQDQDVADAHNAKTSKRKMIKGKPGYVMTEYDFDYTAEEQAILKELEGYAIAIRAAHDNGQTGLKTELIQEFNELSNNSGLNDLAWIDFWKNYNANEKKKKKSKKN